MGRMRRVGRRVGASGDGRAHASEATHTRTRARMTFYLAGGGRRKGRERGGACAFFPDAWIKAVPLAI